MVGPHACDMRHAGSLSFEIPRDNNNNRGVEVLDAPQRFVALEVCVPVPAAGGVPPLAVMSNQPYHLDIKFPLVAGLISLVLAPVAVAPLCVRLCSAVTAVTAQQAPLPSAWPLSKSLPANERAGRLVLCLGSTSRAYPQRAGSSEARGTGALFGVALRRAPRRHARRPGIEFQRSRPHQVHRQSCPVPRELRLSCVWSGPWSRRCGLQGFQ